MSWLSVIPIIGGIIDKVIPDKDSATKAKAELEKLVARGELDLMVEQIKTNRVEAQHKKVFVAGWRPFIGWICGSIFAYHYLIYPIIATIAALNGLDTSVLPIFDLSTMVSVLGGLLGLGTLRTFEKWKGVTK